MNTWTVPLEKQGQIIEHAYVLCVNMVLRRTTDKSTNEVTYHASAALAADEGDYQNGAPQNKRWHQITCDQAAEIMERG